jgi:adenine-specific DNA-methyltransferase
MKDTHLSGESKDIVAENIQQLKQLFPEVFAEENIDFDKLKAVLGEYVDEDDERYNFTWWGKSKALRLAQTPSTGTLRSCLEESKDWDTTQNLYIEGDNLEVLKLLQKSYHGKVDMIFIDPPYNTGYDFVYRDDYKDSLKNYLEITGQIGEEGKKLSTNPETSGRFHTNWLNMIYPRIRLARNLLSLNGVIFISIDDNEHSSLKLVCDEVFGSGCFIGDFVWRSSDNSNNNALTISEDHNYILVYSKKIDWRPNFINYEERRSHFQNPDNDPRGPWFDGNPVNNPGLRPHLQFDIKTPSGKTIQHPPNGWRWSLETINKKIETGEIRFSEDESRIIRRTYLNEIGGLPPSSLCINLEKTGSTRKAKFELKRLFPEIPVVSLFSTPKPTLLIKYLLQIGSKKDSIIMDFFSGSGSTGDAIIQQNVEDGGMRNFVLVQLDEAVDDKNAVYKSISDIGKERIRRAGEKIKANLTEKYQAQQGQMMIQEEEKVMNPDDFDIGFKVFKLDSSNLRKWQPDADDLDASLFASIENFVEGRSELDVVYEIMLKYGIDLTLPIKEYKSDNKTIFSVGLGALMICLDTDITTEVAQEIVRLKGKIQPEVMRVVFRDTGFKDDSAKTNTKEILRTNGVVEIVSI